MERIIKGQLIIGGQAAGRALVSPEPLSFWGGYEASNGEIIDRRHPLSGQIATGRVLALPFSRGSSTTTAVLLEAIRANTAPAAILTTAVDSFFALAVIVAEQLYGLSLPVVMIRPEDFASLTDEQWLTVNPDGTIHCHPFT